jgi:hypothetical protein
MNGQAVPLTRFRAGTLLAGLLACGIVVLRGQVAGPDMGQARVVGSGSRSVRFLDLSLRGEAGDRLARLAGSTDLQGLDLFGTRVDDQDLVHLEGLTGLRALYLESTMIGDAGLVHLRHLKGLRTLALTGTRITDVGLVHLNNLTSLQVLDLSYTGVTDNGIRKLRRALPGAIITADRARVATTPISTRVRAGEKLSEDPASCLSLSSSPRTVGDVSGAGFSCDPERTAPESRPPRLSACPDDPQVVRSEGTELRSISPRTKGEVPVVFIHGMLGAPANWSYMIERLTADASVRERFQLLTFRYDSLQPFPESARELLDALSD